MPDRTTETAAAAAKLLALGMRLSRWAEWQTDQGASAYGLTWRQLQTLQTVEALRNPALGALADALDVTPAVITGLVDRLEASGYLLRGADKADSRVTRVTLTRAGARARERGDANLHRSLATGMAALAPADLAVISRALDMLERIPDAACPHCGAGVQRTDRFCLNCGRHLFG